MKKIEKIIKLIRDIVMILGIPVVISYAYIIHQEQMKIKESTIEFLEAKIENLRENQIDRATLKIKALRDFYDEEIENLESMLMSETIISDSLSIRLNSPIILDSTHIALTINQVKKLLKALLRGERDSLLLQTYIKSETALREQIRINNEMISIQKSQIISYQDFIEKL